MDEYVLTYLISFFDQATLKNFALTNKTNKDLILKKKIIDRYGPRIFGEKPPELSEEEWYTYLKESLTKNIQDYQSDVFMAFYDLKNILPDSKMLYNFIKKEDNKVLLWFIKKGGVFQDVEEYKLAKTGNLEILKIITQPSKKLVEATIKSKNKELVLWFKEAGILPNQKVFEQTIHQTGDLEWIKWFCSMTGWYPDLNYSTKQPKLEIYRWVYDKTKKFVTNLEAPIRLGYFDTTKWLIKTFNLKLSEHHVKLAVLSKKLKMLLIVLEFSWVDPENLLKVILDYGTSEMLCWYRKKFKKVLSN